MTRSPDDLAEERQQLQSILRVHRRRRLQSAMQGISVDPKVLIEIDDITDKIHAYETELADLESLAAADQTPIGEIEYRAMLAEIYDLSDGRLRLAQRTRLAWARVRLGIAIERADEMDHTVRAQLVAELFDDLNMGYLPQPAAFPDPTMAFDFDRLCKAIALDFSTAVAIFCERLPLPHPLDWQAITDKLLDPHSACRAEDLALYQHFLDHIREANLG